MLFRSWLPPPSAQWRVRIIQHLRLPCAIAAVRRAATAVGGCCCSATSPSTITLPSCACSRYSLATQQRLLQHSCGCRDLLVVRTEFLIHFGGMIMSRGHLRLDMPIHLVRIISHVFFLGFIWSGHLHGLCCIFLPLQSLLNVTSGGICASHLLGVDVTSAEKKKSYWRPRPRRFDAFTCAL